MLESARSRTLFLRSARLISHDGAANFLASAALREVSAAERFRRVSDRTVIPFDSDLRLHSLALGRQRVKKMGGVSFSEIFSSRVTRLSESSETNCLDSQSPRGRTKARVFASKLGLSKGDAEFLRRSLLEAAVEHEFGKRYTLDFLLNTDRGKAWVRSGWIIKVGESFPRLTTCYVNVRRRIT